MAFVAGRSATRGVGAGRRPCGPTTASLSRSPDPPGLGECRAEGRELVVSHAPGYALRGPGAVDAVRFATLVGQAQAGSILRRMLRRPRVARHPCARTAREHGERARPVRGRTGLAGACTATALGVGDVGGAQPLTDQRPTPDDLGGFDEEAEVALGMGLGAGWRHGSHGDESPDTGPRSRSSGARTAGAGIPLPGSRVPRSVIRTERGVT